MQAKDVMTAGVVTVAPETPLHLAAKLMLERRISAVPVVDAKGRLQGIVSEGDLVHHVESGTEHRRSWWLNLVVDRDTTALDYVKSHGRTAADVMTRDVVTVSERMPLAKIAALLERHRIKRVPVVRNGRVVGIVSRANLLHGLASRRTPRADATASDREIRLRVLKELDKAGVDRLHVNVVVAQGIAEFWGFVDTGEQRRALRVAAQSVKGLNRVVDHVQLLPPTLRASMGAQ